MLTCAIWMTSSHTTPKAYIKILPAGKPKSAGGGDDDGSNYINQAAIDAHTKATPTADGGVRL